VKIGIGIPSTGTMRTETHLSILGTIYHSTQHEFHHVNQNGCYIHENRWILVQELLKYDCDYIFFVDADMKFRSDTLEKLLAVNKPVVGAAYNMRRFPLETTVKFADAFGNLIPKNADEIPTIPFRCFALGTGCMLIKKEVFEKLPQPWFDFENGLDGKMMTGEDIYFCKQCYKHGIEVWCDPTCDIKHVGTYEY
jgi:hypothetical protein